MIPALTFAAGILVSVFRDPSQSAEARAFGAILATVCFGVSVALYLAGRA